MFRFLKSEKLFNTLKYRVNKTSFSQHSTVSSKMTSTEIRIDVPWGYIAGKWYGPNNIRPVVMLHGWMDNAGTFDTLIPLLPKELSYLSIDLPGHGLSSRLPHGMFYNAMNYIIVLNVIQQHYKWQQLSLCSHSMGGLISTMMASLYPEQCDLLICLDSIMKPYRGPLDSKIQQIAALGKEFLILDEMNRQNKEPPTYTYDEIIGHWAKQTNNTINGVKHLAVRGICQSKINPERYYYSRDIRLKMMEFGSASLSDEIHYKMIERITAPHLFIKCGKSTDYEGVEGYQKAVDVLKANSPKFEWIRVKGGHHCHLSDPTLVSEQISKFITKYRLMSTSTEIKHKM